MQFFDGIPVARMYNTVTNEGKEDQTLEYISSFSYWGIEKEQKEGIPELVSSDDKDVDGCGSQWMAEGADGEEVPVCRSWHGADAAA